MDRRALIIGIYDYDHCSNLSGCVADADAISTALARNEDESRNFDCRTFTSTGPERITPFLRARWKELFGSFTGDAVFYFAGHGGPSDAGGFLVTQALRLPRKNSRNGIIPAADLP